MRALRLFIFVSLFRVGCATGTPVTSVPGVAVDLQRRGRRSLHRSEPEQTGGSGGDGSFRNEEKECAQPYDCSDGCIAIVGNGAVTRGQAALAAGCTHVYRANKMMNANSCANRATHCFFRKFSGGPNFAGVWHWDTARAKLRNKHAKCPHAVLVVDWNTEHTSLSEWAVTETSEVLGPRALKETLWPLWDRMPAIKGVSKSRDPFSRDPSTG
eukprot:CAMPEP_0177781920 /NCGR_PEP_ID=MMETSP0491_2-20121128/18143_1 /TAXON_ID=63592 /ORGANISM="Tetraselmis chuii, Strain PLY429" /LENGTH=212 /DNA_ID=CAMNT_0019302089 /DNA_START=16 /DNA_END=651 /DNA_ORIENTATION=+